MAVNFELTVKRVKTSETGFSLLELIVVLGILGLLLGLVAPVCHRSWQAVRAESSLRQLVLALRTARSQAVTHRQRVRVFINLANREFWLEDFSCKGTFSPELRSQRAHLVWQQPENRLGFIAFYSDGSSSGGNLAFQDRTGVIHLLTVEMVTGRISLSKGVG